MEFRGKTAVITGASAGVGRAVALRLAREGAKLALIARDKPALSQLKAEIEGKGGEALAIAADVSDAAKVVAAADEIESTLGPIELWINNAMATVFSPVEEISPAEFRRVTEVTYLGSVHGTMAALRHMKPRNRGTILQIGSALAYRGIPLQAAYCGAKHALRGFSESLRTELIHDHSDIRVTIVELPAVDTPQFDWARTHTGREPRPMAPVFQPEIVAENVIRAARDPAREYWLGLSTLFAIIGNMFAPGLLDRYLASAAYKGQVRRTKASSARDDNLFRPVKGLHKTHGSFTAEAHGRLAGFSTARTRLGIFTAATVLLLMIGYGFGSRKRTAHGN
ncbi:MAG: SDR family NAD(P)-dependent oxidoreductase [Mesorhizobium sp.]|nr:MAG: SDR family NAD(P)-dependent oxidoreductase [Mesorhizobium sp.]RWM40561.1 MAG: SDR family NAD(P)-dependent oxidoreductase [Mesorhizobium sp.]RWM44206.1 MAG: SDR family NAD(P)-dependent oxidoreductase [Mesorhizobium sp.]RWM45184.1 MAG: SDR family NAD(P)-dependent oxidoreductase [Mesorhizobium sp.]RWM90888.1 MAG: SDR family NAD(P)-dependent oxidoreductase [Mesorhizobium sp.]